MGYICEACSIIPLCRIGTAIPAQYREYQTLRILFILYKYKNDDGVDVDDDDDDDNNDDDDDDTFRFCCSIPSLLLFFASSSSPSSSYFPLINIIIKSSLHRYSISNDNDGNGGGNSNSRSGGNECGRIFTQSNALGCALHSLNVYVCVLFVLLNPQSIRSLNATSTNSSQLANRFCVLLSPTTVVAQ